MYVAITEELVNDLMHELKLPFVGASRISGNVVS